MCGEADCTNQGKHPATNNGCSDATNDINKLLGLWAGRKGLNVGIATGKASNCFVVDVDGHQAEQDLQYLINIHGDLPQTL
ncbi:bifunctional DNA primase/polymerase, partial [Mediterraneibacter glycyrrhizinilyticus]|uniref:bifunctional DNA primase/polymerase n=1 Tax=Mediterraneibacter glycyrrhizinilyticus TaxID=342942 RepID=UPI00196224EB